MKLASTSESRNHIKEHDAHFVYPGGKALLKTFTNTTQIGSINLCIPMRRNIKSGNKILQLRCINELYSTDNWFYTTTSYEGYNCAQIFMKQGQRSYHIMYWQLNQMDQMHYLTFLVSKLSHYQSQETIQICSLVLFVVTICRSSG